MSETRQPSPPKHLSKPARAWWREVVSTYPLESHHLKLLQAACEAWDRLQQARADIAVNGLEFIDRLGQPRRRPAVQIEAEAALRFSRFVRDLGLDLEGMEPAQPNESSRRSPR